MSSTWKDRAIADTEHTAAFWLVLCMAAQVLHGRYGALEFWGFMTREDCLEYLYQCAAWGGEAI